jgi:hypothetical protein
MYSQTIFLKISKLKEKEREKQTNKETEVLPELPIIKPNSESEHSPALRENELGIVIYIYNPSYSGSRDQEDPSFSPAPG